MTSIEQERTYPTMWEVVGGEEILPYNEGKEADGKDGGKLHSGLFLGTRKSMSKSSK